jgi:hypothetical protein
MSVPFSTAAEKLRFPIKDEGSLLLHPQQKIQWAFNFHGPWATSQMHKACENPLASQFLAPILHHRCQICLNRAVSTQVCRAWELGASSSQAGPFLHVAA